MRRLESGDGSKKAKGKRQKQCLTSVAAVKAVLAVHCGLQTAN